jgi:hypothetical protein
MITQTLKRIFSSVKARKNGPGVNADMHQSKEVNYCPRCKSSEIKKTVWRLAGFQSGTSAKKLTERYGLGCEIEWECPCGFKHNGALFKA